MCLTIPAKVLKLNGPLALIKDDAGAPKEIDVSLIPGLEVGDWLLHISNLAVKKISASDAMGILELLEPQRKRANLQNLSQKFQEIIKASHVKDLAKEEIVYLLKTEGKEKEVLFLEANLLRKAHLKDFICIHGIIEFSNFCKNDCLYCGLRKDNARPKRYRMAPEEIVNTAIDAVKNRGYKLLVLQSGEDLFYTDAMLESLIREIKKRCRVFIFMSVGERGYDCYKRMKAAGASGVLFRFETSNRALFEKLHPAGKNFDNRFQHLEFMKKLGYFVATGSLNGLPGQTIGDLADDIITTKKWANMVSSGPLVPSAESAEMNLKMIAILRLLMPKVRIPVTTALETLLGEEGRKQALACGANSLMFNLTPEKYRPLYKIYPDKFYKKEEKWEKYGLFKSEESYKMLEERMSEGLFTSGK